MKRLKPRSYLHFDSQLGEDELANFAPTSEAVARHNFLPLVGFTKVTRKLDFTTFPWTTEEKPRDIRYAAHTDAAIYSRYAEKLSAIYEQRLKELGLSGSVLAYRSNIGFNVTFAHELFDEIRQRGACHVLCFDISGFFDNLNHKALKSRVTDLLGCDRLPNDWHNVFQTVTKYAYVDEKDFVPVLGKPKGGRLCEIVTFRQKVKPLVRVNGTGKGVPQGTPISGLLANIYLLDVDRAVRAVVDAVGGSYRRYSDDICVVLPTTLDAAQFEADLVELMHGVGLELKAAKTSRTLFAGTFGGPLTWEGDRLQYLGFEFDGRRAVVRPQTVRNFYAKMKRGIRRTVKDAKARGVSDPAHIHLRVLMANFTHAGRRNFVSYAYKAADIMKSPAIRKQVARHKRIFDAYLARMVLRYF
jgi:hypothetical protein